MNFGSLLRRLPPAALRSLRQIGDRGVAFWHRGDLVQLGKFFGTDKWGSHWYLEHYQTHFKHLRSKGINVLEIGVGGYADPEVGGASLRMWKAYFPNANIFGLDIYNKRNLEEDRIKIFQGSQIDENCLRSVVSQIGGLDIVVDDGSHVNKHVIRSFEILFPQLRNPGIYVIEDTQTSYWPGFGGSSRDISDRNTIMGYFACLIHSLNHAEILRENAPPTDFDQLIVSIHFYHNLIFICKGDNSEGSNVLGQNKIDARIVFEGIPSQLHGDDL